MQQPLGSRTSGVDGSSEGGRINTIQLPNTLVLYGVSLLSWLRSRGYKGRAKAVPEQVEGVWCLKLVFEGEAPAEVPSRWQGHQVRVELAAGA